MLSDSDFGRLLTHLNRPWAGYRKVRKGVKKRLGRHMAALQCTTVDQYLSRLALQPEERTFCEACLRVTISRFFRDRRLWQTLEERMLPDLGRRFCHPLRVWSAGCACGEEAYSLAVVWNEIAGPMGLHLLATDADAGCLQRARAGIYGRGSLKEVPEAVRTCYFDTRRGGRQYSIRADRLPPVHWQTHDLLHGCPESEPFHLILLRNNLLTYYQGRDQRVAFDRILHGLASGGGLVIGAHERLPSSEHPLTRDADCPWVYWLERR